MPSSNIISPLIVFEGGSIGGNSGWRRWDDEVEWSRLDGPFEVGAHGLLKPSRGPKAFFEAVEGRLERAFTE